MFKSRPFYYQKSSVDCGITCLRMISKFYGKNIATKTLVQLSEVEIVGLSMANIKRTAELIGFKSSGVRLENPEQVHLLKSNLPCIIHWNSNHFVVLYKIHSKKLLIGDPARGLVRIDYNEFYKRAFKTTPLDPVDKEAHILLLEPTQQFFQRKEDKSSRIPKLKFIREHLKDKAVYFLVIFLGLIALMGVQFIMPFITKNVVDLGLKSGDLDMIKYLLLGQAMLVGSKSLFEILRNYVVQHLSVRFNYSLIANFLQKLFKLPIPFFEKRKIGDLLQRIRDHQRLEVFVTKTVLNVIISVLSIIVFSSVLYLFNKTFFVLFLIASLAYVTWILLFINARKKVDWERFEVNSMNQTILVQIIHGIQDLKIYGAYKFLFDKWDKNQRNYIDTSFKSLQINQIQETGAAFIYQMAQIVILYYSARLILSNDLTLGSMLSIEFIIGQLVAPVQQILVSVVFGVEAKLSMDRIFELWDTEEEKTIGQKSLESFQREIVLQDVGFHHSKQDTHFSLNHINLHINKGETIAIVGSSGSGKTTLLKLLLGYYMDYEGSILIDGIELRDLNVESWRKHCGVVLQDNFIFSDTIAQNITMGSPFNQERLKEAVRMADLDRFIDQLPLKYRTIIGKEGKGLSQGQKQRVLLARAIYRDPELFLLDEATNSLDAETELTIMSNLKKYTKCKTVVIIAHRLSTIRFADKILVFENGVISEAGSHNELIRQEGKYFQLVHRQLSTEYEES